MQILYCDQCGMRITEKDVSEGRARIEGAKTLCAKCRPPGTTRAESPVRRSGLHRAVTGPVPPSKSRIAAAVQTAQSPSKSRIAAPAPAAPVAPPAPAKANTLTIVGVTAACFLMGVAVVLLAQGKTESQQSGRTAQAEPPFPAKPQPRPLQPQRAPEKTPEPASGRTQAPNGTEIPSETPEPKGTPADPNEPAVRENLAKQEFGTIFDGVPETDTAKRIERLDAFIEKFAGTIVAARARSQLDQLKAGAGATVPPETPPATAKFLKRDDATCGNWKGVYGTDGYVLSSFAATVKGRQDPSKADVASLPGYVKALRKGGGGHSYCWDPDSQNPDALVAPEGGARKLACDAGEKFLYDIEFAGDSNHRLTLYFADPERNRRMNVEIVEARTGKVLDRQEVAVKTGAHLTWQVGGTLLVRFSKIQGANAVCSGIFFDPAEGNLPVSPDPAAKPPVEPEPAAKPNAAAQARRFQEKFVLEILPVLRQGRFAEAREALDKAARDPEAGEIGDLVAREKADIQAVLDLRRRAVDALRAMPGEKVSLKIGGTRHNGTVKADPERDGITIKLVGGAEMTVGADLLDAEDVIACAPRVDGDGAAEDWRRRGLTMLIAGDADRARTFFSKARDGGLGEKIAPCLERLQAVEIGEAEAGARKAWGDAEALFAAKKWKEAAAAYQEFAASQGQSRTFAERGKDLRDRIRAAAFEEPSLFPAGLAATYYNGKECKDENAVLQRVDPSATFNWGDKSPDPKVHADNFGARWQGWIRAKAAGRYVFKLHTDDQGRLWIDDKQIVDLAVFGTKTGEVELSAGLHDFKLEFHEDAGAAACRLSWSMAGGFAEEVVPASAFCHETSLISNPKNAPQDPAKPEPKTAYLCDLAETEAVVGHGKFGKKDKAIGDSAPVTVGGQPYVHGLFTHPPNNGSAHVTYALGKRYRAVKGAVGINDTARTIRTPLTFKVLGDGKVLWTSGPLRKAGDSQEFQFGIAGVDKLQLLVECPGGNGAAHAVWLDPYISK